MKKDFKIKTDLISFIVSCKGNISELEEEMKKMNFEYEKHVEIENEKILDESLRASQMMRNLIQNFSKERVEEVCKEEKNIWEKRKNSTKGPVSVYKKDNKKLISLCIVVIGLIVLLILTLTFSQGQN
ncbi:MAG: hypothetical protein ACRDDH_01775 [Cetobacterium sp.]|uniref:hypothetical protein n=1 Tax=Cetobacterium sp. TaxID=2071632 RepID=UPI003EE5393A